MLTGAGVRYRQVRMEIPAPRYRASAQQNLTSIRRAGNYKKEHSPCPIFQALSPETSVRQTIISVPDKPEHSLSLAEVSGTQKTTDPKWNNSAINYWATTDAVGAQGIQRGYFVNDHGSAGLDRGTFEAGQPVVKGKWQYTGGEGSFAGITGGGTFKTKLTSATTLEATWEGAYELVGTRAKAV
jgi:hypothetical protein